MFLPVNPVNRSKLADPKPVSSCALFQTSTWPTCLSSSHIRAFLDSCIEFSVTFWSPPRPGPPLPAPPAPPAPLQLPPAPLQLRHQSPPHVSIRQSHGLQLASHPGAAPLKILPWLRVNGCLRSTYICLALKVHLHFWDIMSHFSKKRASAPVWLAPSRGPHKQALLGLHAPVGLPTSYTVLCLFGGLV